MKTAIERRRRNGESDEDERQSAFGLWRYAFEYLKAAQLIDEHDPNEYVASSVTYQCACQAIELAFKAYLRAKGHSVADVRRLSHSLVRCRKRASAMGLRPRTDNDAAAIRMIDPYYKAQEFRYIKTGPKTYPGISELMRAGAVLLDDVARDVAVASGHANLVDRMKLDVSAAFGFTRVGA